MRVGEKVRGRDTGVGDTSDMKVQVFFKLNLSRMKEVHVENHLTIQVYQTAQM